MTAEVVALMWEARIEPGRLADAEAALFERSWPMLRARDGYLSGEVYRSTSPDERLVVISRWRGAAAAAAVPELDVPYVARPSYTWQFVQVDAG